jgi:V8-like Glu-specific endopeptidase
MKGLVSSWYERRQTGADLDPSVAIPKPKAKRQKPRDRNLESIIGDDDRKTVKDVTQSPWRPMVCLQIYAGNQVGTGSGVLIAPNIVLTAAHNLHLLGNSQRAARYPDAITAHVGVSSGVGTAESRVTRVEICPGYVGKSESDPMQFLFDYGIARLADNSLYNWSKKHLTVHTQPPFNDAELKTANLVVAGYPKEDGLPLSLKFCTGQPDAARVGPANFNYAMDSLPGQSGGPVFRYHKDSQAAYFAGVHIAAENGSNLARRYDSFMQKQLQAWLSGAAGGQSIGS